MDSRDFIENKFLGESILGAIEGVRIRKDGKIGKLSSKDMAEKMDGGEWFCWSQEGSFPNQRYRIWFVRPKRHP